MGRHIVWSMHVHSNSVQRFFEVSEDSICYQFLSSYVELWPQTSVRPTLGGCYL